MMNGREIIARVLEHRDPPRIGYDFTGPGPSDMRGDFGMYTAIRNMDTEYGEWGRYPELLAKVEDFAGEVCMRDGSVYGRLNKKTNGECVRAALEDGWGGYEEFFEKYLKPYGERGNYDLKGMADGVDGEKFNVFAVMSLQSGARDARRIDNMLADTILEADSLRRFVDDCADIAIKQIEMLQPCGADAVMMLDDWGLQHSLYISPESWRAIWREPYARVIDRLHDLGMKYLLHSCGNVSPIVDDFVEIGLDAFQFDQPALYDFEKLRNSIRGKASLWSPVDIQKVLPTGDRELIQAEAARMVETFHDGGGFIAKDYPSYSDIGVSEEWAQYARDAFTGYKY